MKINYFLKDKKKTKTSIDGIIRYKGQRYKLATGISVETEFWDVTTKRARQKKEYPDFEIINLHLGIIETEISGLFNKYAMERKTPTPAEFKTAYAAIRNSKTSKQPETDKTLFVPFFTEYYQKSNYHPTTIKGYVTTGRWLQRYEAETGKKLTFNDINLTFYTTFRKWVLSQKYAPRKDATPRSYSLNYFGSLIKCIKRAMNASGPDSLLKLHTNTEYTSSQFKVESETADTIYLSAAELTAIHTFTPTKQNTICGHRSVEGKANKLRKIMRQHTHSCNNQAQQTLGPVKRA